VLEWHFTEGRLEEDFRVSEIRPGLFYTARAVPFSHETPRGVKGALVCRVKGTNQCYTLAFQDGFYDRENEAKGFIEEGDNWERAINCLSDGQPKNLSWGSYEWKEIEGGRGRSVFVIGKSRL
jgi:hypothetical protein